MTVADLLRAARKRIERPENWTQGELARNASGEKRAPRQPDACRWCLTGAVFAEDGPGFDAFDALRAAANAVLPEFNDSHTHAEVLSVFDRAIAAVESTP